MLSHFIFSSLYKYTINFIIGIIFPIFLHIWEKKKSLREYRQLARIIPQIANNKSYSNIQEYFGG